MEPLFKTKINGCVYESLGIAGYFPVHQHQSLMRGRMLELPLKPLLHIAFVTAWCSLFSVILSINLPHRFCLPCVRVGKLFGWFWSCDGFLCDQPMCLTTELGFLY